MQVLDERAFASLLIDLFLTRRATGAHLDGRVTLDPRYAEELLGKTWRDQDLEPATDLDLLEVGLLRKPHLVHLVAGLPSEVLDT